MAPKTGQDEVSVPHRSVLTYKWQHPRAMTEKVEQRKAKITVGEEVWMKLLNARVLPAGIEEQ